MARRHLALVFAAIFPILEVACSGDETAATTATGTSSATSGTMSSSSGMPSVDDIMNALPQSCAFECTTCAEPDTPFSCPTIAPYDTLPHDDACGSWDGKFPSATPGKCTSSDATGESARKAGPYAGGLVLPDGHRITPAGREVEFHETDLVGTYPMSILPLAGSRFALSSDGGIDDNTLRLIDLDALATAAGEPVKAYVKFPRPMSLFYGLAYATTNRVYASGGGDGMVYAFDVNVAAGTLTRAPSGDIALGMNTTDGALWYSGPIAVTGDGTRLLVAPNDGDKAVLVISLAQADYGTKLGSIAIKSHNTFDLQRDPFDAGGNLFYLSDEGGATLYEIDAAQMKATRTIALDKNPAQIAFLDATYLVVAESDSDKLAVINRTAGTVDARIPVFEDKAPRGFSPATLAFDPVAKRLYATLGGVNAVEVYDVAAGAPPTITPAGRIPTAWWPTAVMVDADGSLVILNGKGHGAGTDDKQYPWAKGPITERMHGSIQHVAPTDLANLAALSAEVDQNRNIGTLPDAPKVTCPNGADDFPIPIDNTHGPSKVIKHLILVVRENKTYDGVFGDRADLGDGDPKLIMASDAVLEEKIWKNARAIAKQFVNFDNFYTDAEQSLQGHTWTVFGRSTDFFERSWLTIWGRGSRNIGTAVNPAAVPEEGGVFSWLTGNKIDNQDMGEIVGLAAFDLAYPGGLYAQNTPDIEKTCYIAGRARLRCDLKTFTYALNTNDHTYGGDAGYAAPEVMIAVNDEAIGILLDGLSHSPIWKDSLLMVTEDDPQDGGDHVDLHRSLLFMASPWVKHGYVSHGHYDMGSVYKLVAHVLGIPYNNEMMRNAILPVDAFTSTPDYGGYTYTPRTVAAPCNASGSMEADEAKQWDFDDLDDQPGLSQQIMRMLKKSREERGIRVVR